jgi:hypothetical protein
VVEVFLSDHLVDDDPSDRLVLQIVGAMADDRELNRVDQVTDQVRRPARSRAPHRLPLKNSFR